MDTFDNRLKLLEEKLSKMALIINALEEKNKYLENLSRCSFCRNIRDLFCCSSCYAKVCGECNIVRERTGRTGDVEIIIFCRTCL
jgi:hypothetical protein